MWSVREPPGRGQSRHVVTAPVGSHSLTTCEHLVRACEVSARDEPGSRYLCRRHASSAASRGAGALGNTSTPISRPWRTCQTCSSRTSKRFPVAFGGNARTTNDHDPISPVNDLSRLVGCSRARCDAAEHLGHSVGATANRRSEGGPHSLDVAPRRHLQRAKGTPTTLARPERPPVRLPRDPSCGSLGSERVRSRAASTRP
jgi:hypothetical protein